MKDESAQEYETGITSHVLTINSNLKVYDLLNIIVNKKSSAILQWMEKLDIQLDNIVIVGAYLTGLGIANLLKGSYENITIVDIYPHLQELVDKFPMNNEEINKIKFSSNINLIKTADCVIDTSGLGGLSIKQIESISPKVFIIEDPIAEENDELLTEKNNINERFKVVKSQHKAILKTNGLDTKTSGTMTFTVDVMLKSINHALKEPGVLYGVSELTFFEGLIFKEKNIQKFLNAINTSAITISTLTPYNLDNIMELFLDKINPTMIG
ncbi:MAG: DUF1188 domain-containing protein [Methanobrevibacter sp.]|nr:DUF1188 domain-containing protein [Methanobrevibacter sp.]